MTQHDERLRETLYRVFRGSPTPLLMGESFGIPGASLWSGARLWVGAFRELGLGPGDGVALALPICPAQVMATIAAWWQGMTVCPVEPSETVECLHTTGAALLIARSPGPHTLVPAHDGEPGFLTECRIPGTRSPDHAARFTSDCAWQRVDAVRWEDLESCANTRAQDAVVTVHATACLTRADMLGRLWSALLAGSEVRVDSRGLRGDIKPTRVRGTGLPLRLS